MPGMRFTIGIIRYLNAGPAFRATLVAFDAPGETAYTAIPEGRRRASAPTHQTMVSFASAYALFGAYFTFGPLRIRASTAAVLSPPLYLAAKAGRSVYLNMGTPPRAGAALVITIRASGLNSLALSNPTVS